LTRLYQAELVGVCPSQLIFLDEAGACLNLIVDYGRSPRGQRVTGEKPTAKGQRISTVAALSWKGLETAFCYAGTLTAEVFVYFLTHFLVPCLRPGQVVILDNAAAHRDARVVPLIEATGARVVYLPPYSPHLNPIELAWAKIKHPLRKAAARTGEALYQAWAEALETLSPTDVKGFFRHVGLCV
jgi:transposase